MMKISSQKIVVVFLAISFNLCIFAADKITQKQIVNFPKLGRVEITVLEAQNDSPRLVFRNFTSKKLLREISWRDKDNTFKIFPDTNTSNPRSRFKVINSKGFNSPLIFAVGIRPGGSDDLFRTFIIGARDGKIQIMNELPFEVSLQGGTFVGYLGKKYGYGAIEWSFIWKDGNAHYAYHPFRIRIFRFNPKTFQLDYFKTLKTKKDYYYANNPSAPLQEFSIKGRDLIETIQTYEDRREW